MTATPSSPRPTFRGRAYAAFLFDMDGTMLDSSVVVARVWGEWAVRNGLDRDTVLATVHGVRAADTIARWAPAADQQAEYDWVLRAELDDVAGVVPIEGIGAVVAGLAPDRWAIVTSAPRDLAAKRLAAAGLPLPPTFIGAEDVSWGKPDPEGFALAAEQLGVPIGECLVFEDSTAGIAAGLTAGAQVVAIGGHAHADVVATMRDYSSV